MSCIENLLLKKYRCFRLLRLQAIGMNKVAFPQMRLNQISLLFGPDLHSGWKASEMPLSAEGLLLPAQLFLMLLRK